MIGNLTFISWDLLPGNKAITGSLLIGFTGNSFSFEITSVKYTNDQTADVAGNLNIKGISVPVKFVANIRSADDKGFFAQAFLSIDRTLLGLNYGAGMVSNDVQLAIHIFGTK